MQWRWLPPAICAFYCSIHLCFTNSPYSRGDMSVQFFFFSGNKNILKIFTIIKNLPEPFSSSTGRRIPQQRWSQTGDRWRREWAATRESTRREWAEMGDQLEMVGYARSARSDESRSTYWSRMRHCLHPIRTADPGGRRLRSVRLKQQHVLLPD